MSDSDRSLAGRLSAEDINEGDSVARRWETAARVARPDWRECEAHSGQCMEPWQRAVAPAWPRQSGPAAPPSQPMDLSPTGSSRRRASESGHSLF